MLRLFLYDLPYEVVTFDPEEMIDWMLDHKADTVVNNLTTRPFIEYHLNDLHIVWESIIANEYIVNFLFERNKL